MKAKVKKVNIPSNRRMIVISDIHGHYYHLKNLLEKVNFSKADILFIVGDIIEKGPMSLRTLRYIMKLCDEYTVYPLIGNVDASRLIMLEDVNDNSEELFKYIKSMEKYWDSCFLAEMCSEINIIINGPSDIPKAKEMIKVYFKEELDFLRSLPAIIETKNYIFVHGGLPSEDIDSFDGTNVFQYLKNDAFMEKGLEFSKYVVTGHWPVTLYNAKIAASNPIINKKQKIICIDGGCGLKRDGQLNALIIPDIYSEDISFECYDDFSVGIAQTNQEESVNSINIRYTENHIKILEKEEEFSYAEHKTSGYRLWIHNDYIFKFGEDGLCDDYTDYRLSVNKGDKISIIRKTSKGYLIKKDGISGWYEGIIEYEHSNGNDLHEMRKSPKLGM